MNLARLISVAALAQKYPDLFPEATVRGWINANMDRFRDLCVVMVGGKVTVDQDALLDWLESRRGRRPQRATAYRVTSQRSRRPSRTFAEVEAELARQAAGQR